MGCSACGSSVLETIAEHSMQDVTLPCAEVPVDSPSAPLIAAVEAGSEPHDADGAGAGYVAVLRAALARAAPPTAVATVMAWLQVNAG